MSHNLPKITLSEKHDASQKQAELPTSKLHPNSFIAVIQILVWTFYNPSAWRNYVRTIAPDLHPWFNLNELRLFRKNKHIRRLTMLSLFGTLLITILPLATLSLIDALVRFRINPLISLLSTTLFLGISCLLIASLLSVSTASAWTIIIPLSGFISNVFSFTITVLITIALDIVLYGGEAHFTSSNGLDIFVLTIGFAISLGIIHRSTSHTHRRERRGFTQERPRLSLVTNVLIFLPLLGFIVFINSKITPGLVKTVVYSFVLCFIIYIAESLRQLLQNTTRTSLYPINGSDELRNPPKSDAETAETRKQLEREPISLISWISLILPTTVAMSASTEILMPLWLRIFIGIVGASVGLVWTDVLFRRSDNLFTPWNNWLYEADSKYIQGNNILSSLLSSNVLRWNNFINRIEKIIFQNIPTLLWMHSGFWNEYDNKIHEDLADHVLMLIEEKSVEAKRIVSVLYYTKQRPVVELVMGASVGRSLYNCAGVMAISGIHRSTQTDYLAPSERNIIMRFQEISTDIERALHHESVYNQRSSFQLIAKTLIEFESDLMLRESSSDSRYAPIAQRWSELVEDRLSELDKSVGQQEEIDNPYIVGPPLTVQQEIFVGRGELSVQIERLILDPRRSSILLYGQRRMGKTSLLNNLGKMLPSSIVPLFVNLQRSASTETHEGLFYDIARAISESARQQRDVELPTFTRETFNIDPFSHFLEWLDNVEKVLGSRTALLMFDEFEILDKAFAQQRFDTNRVLGIIRDIIQHRSSFKILISGSHTLKEFRQWASYLINLQVTKITYLKEHEAIQLIERPVRHFPLSYSKEASQYVFYLTRGHPYLVQLICFEIVAKKNTQSLDARWSVSIEDVKDVIPVALESGDMFFADIAQYLQHVNHTAHILAHKIAVLGEGKLFRPTDCAVGVVDDIDAALSVLEQRELIEHLVDGYRFQVELIRKWFEQNPE